MGGREGGSGGEVGEREGGRGGPDPFAWWVKVMV